MTVFVLGWDGLDGELADRYGVAEVFGESGLRPIDTITNPVIGKPHTWELWPTIITGLTPDEHGIRAEAFIAGGGFDARWLNLAARWSADIVPETIRWRVGRWLRDRGASFAFKSMDYYGDRDIPTVLDGDSRIGIGVPNARSAVDDALAIETDRGRVLADYLESAGGSSVRRPTVPPRTLRARAEADVARKIGAMRAYRDHELVFAWLPYVDTLGHVAPTIEDDDEWVAETYETAAAYTRFVRDATGPDDTVVCVSDHGVEDGRHTEMAYIGSWPGVTAADVQSVVGIGAALEAACRPASAASRASYDGGAAAVDQRLRELGYIE